MKKSTSLLTHVGNDSVLRGAIVLTQSQINLLLGLAEDVYVPYVETDVLRNQTFFHLVRPYTEDESNLSQFPRLYHYTDGRIADHSYLNDQELLLRLEDAAAKLREKLTPAIQVNKGRNEDI